MRQRLEWVFRWRGYLVLPYAILLLIVGNPTKVSYFVGMIPIFGGEFLRFWGVGFVGKVTRESMLRAPVLITAGPFAYFRHPLYLGNSLIGFGAFLMAAGNVLRWKFFLLLSGYLFFYGMVYGILMGLEEKFLERMFGETYREYKQQVPRLIPRTAPYPAAQGTFHWATAWSSEIYTLIPLSIALVVIGLYV